MLLSFVCPPPFGSEDYLTLPYCISLKGATSCPPPPTCPGPKQGSEVTREEGKRQGPVKCFKVFLGWGLSKAQLLREEKGGVTLGINIESWRGKAK